MEEIKDLIDFCSIRNNITIEDYVKELVKILIYKYDLKSYMEFLAFNKASKLSVFKIYSVSAYDMTNNGIIIFKQDFEQVVDSKSKELDIDDILYKKYRLYLITRAILHEIEHAKQKKMVLEKINANYLEYQIVYLTLKHLFDEYPNYIDEKLISEYQDKIESSQFAFYNSSPTERLAEIKSNSNMIKLVDDSYIKESFKADLNEKKLRGYSDDICSPTIYFFNQISKSDIFKTNGVYKNYIPYSIYINDMEFYDEDEDEMIMRAKKLYDFDKRLFYGLPISKDEYKTLTKK